ncbi:MAG TPA: adenylyltransferase/cytidyltransferase family protein [Candidatus Saccharimonadales bacterium]|nr:adenylyltransferase/cytidyltransferase family protein [Candidatus Saccharimonadales bacterium]
MKHIGVFAGVFDPIHLGHTNFVKQTIDKHGLDKMFILVEKNPRYKQCLASYEDRIKMAELALEDIPQAEIYEGRNESFPISSNLPAIKSANPTASIFLLLGDDVAEHIDEWQDAEELLRGVELVVAKRGQNSAYSKISSLKVREELKRGNNEAGLAKKVLDYCTKNKIY